MRRPWSVSIAGVSVVMLLGCEQPAAVVTGDVVGSWSQATQQLSPWGTYEFRATFTQGGLFTTEGRMYGVYGGQASREISSYSRTEGSYRTEGNRLIMSPRRLTSWDRFYGASSPERVDEPYPYSGYFDDARYEVNGTVLTLRYTIYPADAPVPTSMELRRGD